MDEIKAKVKEWEKTKNIATASEVMELLAKMFAEEA